MSSGIESTTYAIMAYGHSIISKGLNAGKPSKEFEEARIEQEREEERSMVIPIYDSRGKIVGQSEGNRRYLENYREFLKQKKAHVYTSA
jgi:hypothetical protein